MSLVVFNVLVAALVVDLLRLCGNGGLHRDDAHDAGTHGGVGSMVDLAGGGVLLEGVGDLRMLDAELLVDEKELEDTGSVRRQEIDLQADFRDQDLHHHTDIGELMQDILGLFLAHFGSSGDTGDKCRFHALQRHQDRDLIIGDPLLECFVLRAVGGDLVVTIVDLFTQFNKILSNFQIVTLLMAAAHATATFYLTV